MKKQFLNVIVPHVRAILEQNVDPGAMVVAGDLNTIGIEALIGNTIEEAVNTAVVNADVQLFTQPDGLMYVPADEAYEIQAKSRIVAGWKWIDSDNVEVLDSNVKLVNEAHYYKADNTEVNANLVTEKYVPGTGEAYYGTSDGTLVYKVMKEVYRRKDTEKVVARVDAATEVLESVRALKDGYAETDGKNIKLPKDMVRFLSVVGDEWESPVTELLDPTSAIYRICKDKYVKSIGVKDRPCAFYHVGADRRVEIFPQDTEVVLTYIKKPAINEGDNSIECDEQILEGACFYCAYLVANILGWANAASYKQQAMEALRIQAVPAATAPVVRESE